MSDPSDDGARELAAPTADDAVASEEIVDARSDAREDVKVEALLLERAIGGWRGIIDSGVPTVVFVIAYLATGNNLSWSVGLALGAGMLIVAWRLIRREPLGQILAGFVGVAISAWLAKVTGTAENYFIPGFLQNLGYGLAFLVSILVGWPLLGVAMGYLTGDGTSWRRDRALRRAYSAASWIWVALFFGRLAVQVPFYLAGNVAVLGVLKIVMGIPLYIAAAYFTYRLLRPIYDERRAARRSGVAE